MYDEKETLEPDDKFLLDYIALEGWKGSSKFHQDKKIDKEDDDLDSEADRYEEQYNFRHENKNTLITTHGRDKPEDSLRRQDDKRK